MSGQVKVTKNSVRIIAGKWRGRLLPVLDADGLRPTKDFIRETLFNWLQYEIPGANCLDLFAGTGALGLEAASRGAAAVTLLERDAAVVAHLQSLVDILQADNVKMIQTDAMGFIRQTTQRYDIIFVDPPFQQNLWQQVLSLIVEYELLADRGCIYLEVPKKIDLPALPPLYKYRKQKSSGQVVYGLIERSLQ